MKMWNMEKAGEKLLLHADYEHEKLDSNSIIMKNVSNLNLCHALKNYGEGEYLHNEHFCFHQSQLRESLFGLMNFIVARCLTHFRRLLAFAKIMFCSSRYNIATKLLAIQHPP